MGLELRVTRVADRWVAQLTESGVVHSQMACALKCDIGWICRELLRWYDKLGGVSKWASSARRRQTDKPKGKVWRTLEL